MEGSPRATHATTGGELLLALPADPSAPGRARRAIDAGVGLAPSLREDVRLLVSELMTNVVRHSGLGPDDEVTLSIRASNFRVRIEIADSSDGFSPAPPVAPPPSSLGGRGILLVRRLASHWGARRDGDRFIVWVELRRSARVGAPAPCLPAGSRRVDQRLAPVTCAVP